MVSRTGYTGDLGYELWIDPDRALALWDRLFAAGQQSTEYVPSGHWRWK